MTHVLQEKIQALLDRKVADGEERGAQVAVYKNGQLIVDAWAGIADSRTGSKVNGDTLFPVFSTTKGILATVIHILAERGKIDYDQPIAHYWPEFAAKGKGGITVRHALTHTSGIPYMPEGIDHAQLTDWDTMCRAIAQVEPVWPPGNRFRYHPITYSWILGEVARRVDGRPLPLFIADEISGPLGLKTLYAGVPAELEPGVAFLEEIFAEPVDPPAPVNPKEQDLAPCMQPLSAWMNRSDARLACIPGGNGVMAARAVARHYASLLPGGVDGVQLLPDSRVQIAIRQEILRGPEGEVLPDRRGLGYILGEGGMEAGFGHGGYGGSAGYGNVPHRLAVSVTRNRFSANDLAGQVAHELRNELQIS